MNESSVVNFKEIKKVTVTKIVMTYPVISSINVFLETTFFSLENIMIKNMNVIQTKTNQKKIKKTNFIKKTCKSAKKT